MKIKTMDGVVFSRSATTNDWYLGEGERVLICSTGRGDQLIDALVAEVRRLRGVIKDIVPGLVEVRAERLAAIFDRAHVTIEEKE